MGDRMRPPSFAALMERVLEEYARQETVLGVAPAHGTGGGRVFPLFGEPLESPAGPAAGPHTQLAGNIVAAYAAGGRFFELKTVQTLDGEDLRVAKPCILAEDEGYNCEWSTELTVPEAMDEYIRAWYALKLLSRALGLGGPRGFVFNLSVGYDLQGIRSQKIDRFIEGLRDASGAEAFAECRAWAEANLSSLNGVDRAYLDGIDPRVSASATLSTLHGCPAEEIERIAEWLMEGKGLHTFVKLNPTLLGYGFARDRLDALGYGELRFGDFHFRDDLQYADAVPMLGRLQALAEKRGLLFGVKLTNTLPVDAAPGGLPAREVYLSGRALFPLSVALAARLAEDFEGRLRISFSGGADARNIGPLAQTGVFPVTVATTLLKPGGYQRLRQLSQLAAESAPVPTGPARAEALVRLAAGAAADRLYARGRKPRAPRAREGKLPLLDCFRAGCRPGCPIGQDVPAYLHHAEKGEWLEALRVIADRNPLPFITGTLCPAFCRDGCARAWYEEPVDIRGVKLACARAGYDALMAETRPRSRSGRRVAVVGAGPAGLACAFFLSRAGCEVTVFDKGDRPGGLVSRVVPAFRIGEGDIARDAALCLRPGAELKLHSDIADLKPLWAQGYGAVALCVGAAAPEILPLREGEAMEALDFLRKAKREPQALPSARNIAVIGGGNSAMDAARAALRLPGVRKVSLVYRRTARYMPAAEEELNEALADGVGFLELLSPLGWDGRNLECARMALGKADASGRRAPVETGETVRVPADLVVAAVGEKPDAALYRRLGLPVDKRGLPVIDPDTFESPVKGVYVAGDGRRGPATVVEAIADASRVAAAITGSAFDESRHEGDNAAAGAARARTGRGEIHLDPGARPKASRCLQCAAVCEHCVETCPNRANVTVEAEGRPQIVHLDWLCNECGNCAAFCPFDAEPFREKLTLFASREDFLDSSNPGFLPLSGDRFLIRLGGETWEDSLGAGSRVPPDIAAVMAVAARRYGGHGRSAV